LRASVLLRGRGGIARGIAWQCSGIFAAANAGEKNKKTPRSLGQRGGEEVLDSGPQIQS
jgi:hypothetical protein